MKVQENLLNEEVNVCSLEKDDTCECRVNVTER